MFAHVLAPDMDQVISKHQIDSIMATLPHVIFNITYKPYLFKILISGDNFLPFLKQFLKIDFIDIKLLYCNPNFT